MRRLAAILTLVSSAGAGMAQDIRAYYQRQVVDPVPERMMQALVVAEEREASLPHHLKSTISAQLARIMAPGRKGAERVVVSARVAQVLDPQEQVQLYGALVDLGQHCHGVREASQAYFGRPVEALSLAEMAFLAWLPNAPYRYHPSRAPDRALARRNEVLDEMERVGLISGQDAATARSAPLGTRLPLGRCENAPPMPLFSRSE